MDQELVLNVLGFNVYYIIEIVGYILFALIGSGLKEIYLYKIKHESTHTGRMWRIIIGTCVAMFLTMAVKDYLLHDEGTWKTMAFIGFFFGVLGFDLFGKLASIDGLKELAKDIHDIYITLFTYNKNEEKKEEDKKKEQD